MDVPTKRTVLRRKELKLQPPALMLLSDLGHVLSLDCMQYIRPSPIMICRRGGDKGEKENLDGPFLVCLHIHCISVIQEGTEKRNLQKNEGGRTKKEGKGR